MYVYVLKIITNIKRSVSVGHLYIFYRVLSNPVIIIECRMRNIELINNCHFNFTKNLKYNSLHAV